MGEIGEMPEIEYSKHMSCFPSILCLKYGISIYTIKNNKCLVNYDFDHKYITRFIFEPTV